MIHTEPLRSYLHTPAFLSALDLTALPPLSPLAQGEYHVNYVFTHPDRGERLVLRINRGSQMHLADQIGYEYSALRLLETSRRTPRPLFCEPSQKLLVMQYLPGEALDYRRDMDAAAAILADIHAVPVTEDSPLLRPQHPARSIYEECCEMVRHYFDWERADPTLCRLLRTLMDAIARLPLDQPSRAPRCIVNTELNSGNFLINPGAQSYLVDWEKPLLSEPAQDLGHFLAPTTTFWKTDVILTPAEVAAFVRQYIAAVDGRIDCATLHERLPLFFALTCLRGVTWCAMALREYCESERDLVNADTFAKLRAYMSEDFLTNILENYVRKDFLA